MGTVFSLFFLIEALFGMSALVAMCKAHWLAIGLSVLVIFALVILVLFPTWWQQSPLGFYFEYFKRYLV
jgi:hypothetical protein